MNEKERFLVKVWPRVVEFFNRFGPSNYEGYLGSEEQGWLGPYVWSENGDTLRLITRFCEDEFGFLNVHNESKIDKFMYANFSAKEEPRMSIDIDVTDASNCKDYHKFRELTHTLFIEVKEISKGGIFRDWEKKIKGFKKDCEKLQHQVCKGRCKYAIAILIDDGDLNGKPYVIDRDEFIGKLKSKYPDVEPLIWQKRGDNVNHGLHTGEMGYRLYKKYIDSSHIVYYDHGKDLGDEPNLCHPTPFFDKCCRTSTLSYVDVAVVNSSNRNTNLIELIAEIEESGAEPKRIIGDIVNIVLSDGVRIQGKDYNYGSLVFILGIKTTPGGEAEEKARRIIQKLVRINEEMGNKKIEFITVFDDDMKKLIQKVESEIDSKLAIT